MRTTRRWTAAVIAAALALTPVASASAATGPEAFQANDCNSCHTVKVAGVSLTRDGELETDLSKVGATYDKKWIARFLLRKVDKDGEQHKKKFRGEKEALKVIATWLGTLK